MSFMIWSPLKMKSAQPFEMSGAARLMVRCHLPRRLKSSSHQPPRKTILFGVWETFVKYLITKNYFSLFSETIFIIRVFHCRVAEDLDPHKKRCSGPRSAQSVKLSCPPSSPVHRMLLFYLQNPYQLNIIDRQCRKFSGWLRRQVWAHAPPPLPRLRFESVRTARAAAVKEGWVEGLSERTGRFYGTAKIEPFGTCKIWLLHRCSRYHAERHGTNRRTKIYLFIPNVKACTTY